MKKTLQHLLTAWLCLQASITYGQLTENFSDSNYSQNPKWICSDNEDWIINHQFQLQSNRTVSNSAYWISTSQTLADSVQWEIDVQLAFNPSSVNFIDIYLICSDSLPVAPTATGYFIRVGNTDDEIAFYRKDVGNKITKIIDGINGILNKSNNRYRIKVTRRNSAQWNIWYDDTMSGAKYVGGGAAIDSAYLLSQYFSLYVQQSTAGFFQKHFLDNMHISAYLPDTISPGIKSINIVHPQKIAIYFNEAIPNAVALTKENYFIDQEVGHPNMILQDSLSANGYFLLLNKPLISGMNYQLQVSDILDVSNNKMNDTVISLFYYVAKPGDIIINEILFNPIGNGSDYIEIMNRSGYPINIKGFCMDNTNSAGASINKKTLFNDNYEMQAGEIIAFTDDRQNILSSFYVRKQEQLIELSSLPSLPNEGGNIRLLNQDGLEMDALEYDEKWHFPLLNQREGVALERISPSASTQNADNWHSASKSSGYGTPTASNSQLYVNKEVDSWISLSSAIFSPDHDGNEDALYIQYDFPEGGYVLNCMIFDMWGRSVKTLQRNMLCGTSGMFKWDGLDAQQKELPMGHYIVFVEIFNLKGAVKKHKHEVVLARRR